MSEKGTLKLNDGNTTNANTIFEQNTRGFVINDLDTNEKVSDKKLYSKNHSSYKHYLFYEHNNKHISLKIFLLNVSGRYHIFDDGSKTMKFILNDALLEKNCEICSNIEAKLEFDINDFTYDRDYGQHFKTKVTNKTCFRQNNNMEEIILPRQCTDYKCRILVKIESVFLNNNNNKDDIVYYPHVFLGECR